MNELIWGTYENLAHEYYDAARHPTSANFREASRILLRGWLHQHSAEDLSVCEVGAGKSLLAEMDVQVGVLTLVDSSPSMLAYSQRFAGPRVKLILGDALRLPPADSSVELLVSSLGDPYNEEGFWKEVFRVLQPGRLALFTTPSYEWAAAFRRSGRQRHDFAQFELRDGRRLCVPSLIHPEEIQRKLIESSGLIVKRLIHVRMAELRVHPLSPKLCPERGPAARVVTGYELAKPG